MQQHPVTERDCAAFQPISFAFLIILALKHEAVFLISSPSPSAASLCPQVISSWQCPAHVPLINLLQTAFPWALHHSHSSFRDDLPSQRLCGSHRNIRSSEFLSRCELAALGAAQPLDFPWQGNAGAVLERVQRWHQLCRSAPKSTNSPWISSGADIFDLEQEFTAQRVPPSPPAFARSLPPREAKPPFIA